MKVNTIKELESVLKLCRKQGVTDIKIDGIELHILPQTQGKMKSPQQRGIEFPDLPMITPGNITETTPIAEAVQIATDELSEEELLFYSSRQETGTESGPKIGTN